MEDVWLFSAGTGATASFAYIEKNIEVLDFAPHSHPDAYYQPCDFNFLPSTSVPYAAVTSIFNHCVAYFDMRCYRPLMIAIQSHAVYLWGGGTMNLANLTISRIIFHEVFRRRDDLIPQQPAYGVDVTVLRQDAMDELRERIINATSSQSQSMQMTIVGSGVDSAVAIAHELLAAPDDASFSTISKRVAAP